MAVNGLVRTSSEFLENVIKEHDHDDPNIEIHFSKQQLAKMSDYEKRRLRNIKRNFMVMKAMGIKLAMPEFMTNRMPDKQKANSNGKCPSEALDAEKISQNRIENAAITVENYGRQPGSVTGWRRGSARLLAQLFKQAIAQKEKRLSRINANTTTPAALQAVDPISEQDTKGWHSRYGTQDVESDVTAAEKCAHASDGSDFVYCETCCAEYRGLCTSHGLCPDSDHTYASGDDFWGEAPVDLVTLTPPGSAQAGVGVGQESLGVWANGLIEKDTVFGPYLGTVVTPDSAFEKSPYAWTVCRRGRPHHLVDARVSTEGSWMRFVNCAAFPQQQNLVAFQYRGEIFYRATEEIKEGCELLVWYGDRHGKGLHADQSPKPKPCKRWRTLPALPKYTPDIASVDQRKDSIEGMMAEETASQCFFCNDKISAMQPVLVCHVTLCSVACRDVTETMIARADWLKCRFCERRCPSKHRLKLHERVHTGDHPYRCRLCGKGFHYGGKREEHERRHRGERPHSCGLCGRRYAASRDLRRHANQAHPLQLDAATSHTLTQTTDAGRSAATDRQRPALLPRHHASTPETRASDATVRQGPAQPPWRHAPTPKTRTTAATDRQRPALLPWRHAPTPKTRATIRQRLAQPPWRHAIASETLSMVSPVRLRPAQPPPRYVSKQGTTATAARQQAGHSLQH